MVNNEELYFCRICGFRYYNLPWGENNDNPSREICPCCGVEFGYEDSNLLGIQRYRKKWLETGAKWFEPRERPDDWSLEKQLEQIPKQYR